MEEPSFEQEFYFQWHITERCNLRCKHCYHDTYSSENELVSDELVMVVHEIEKALTAWNKTGSISLTGGEPFLRRADLYMIMDLLDKSPPIGYYDVLTNGSLIDENDISKLKDHKKLRRIQLSLEAPNQALNDRIRDKNAYDTSIKAIRKLKRAEFSVAIMMTLSRLNMDYIDDIVGTLIQEKVDTLSVERFIPEGKGAELSEYTLTQEDAKEAFKHLYEIGVQEKRLRILMYRPLFALIDPEDSSVGAICSVGINALTIMHDGTLLPCRRLPIPIGHILRSGIFKAWYDSELLWLIRDAESYVGECGSCELLSACRGCRAMAYRIYGDYLANDPHCWKGEVACLD